MERGLGQTERTDTVMTDMEYYMLTDKTVLKCFTISFLLIHQTRLKVTAELLDDLAMAVL